MSIDARIPLSFTSGREAEQLGNGILTGQSIAANRQQLAVGEAEAAAAKRQKEMQGLTAITNSLAYLDTMPPERQGAALENIKRFARQNFDDPNGYIDQITLENLPQIRAAITPYMDQLKEGTQAANTGLVNAKTADIGYDNARADWKTSADIADANQRTALYGSGIANANANRDAGTALAYEKARVTGFGQLPEGQIIGADGTAQTMPGYVAPPPKRNPGAEATVPKDIRVAEMADIDAIQAAETLAADAQELRDRVASGDIDVSLQNRGRAFIANTFGTGGNEKTAALGDLDTFKTRYVNESLRLNKGVQTEGDAQRAAQELQAANDPGAVIRALDRLTEINRRAAGLRRNTIGQRRQIYGLPEIDLSGVGGAGGVYAPLGTPQQTQSALPLPPGLDAQEGDEIEGPDGTTYVVQNGRLVPQ